MRYTVEQWAPEYGSSVEAGALAESQATVDVSVELPAEQWRALAPATATPVPDEIAFVDGVRRVEARVWVTDDRGVAHQGICASYAAGVVRCNGVATVVDAVVQRSLFCDGPDLVPILTRHGRLRARRAPIAAVSSMRLLVVLGSAPIISFSEPPALRTAPQPPGPGLPRQAPSV